VLNQSSHHEVNCEYLIIIHPSSGVPRASQEQGPVSRPEPSSRRRRRRWHTSSAATSGTRGKVSPASRDHSQLSPTTAAAQRLAINMFSYKPLAPYGISSVTSTHRIAFESPYLGSKTQPDQGKLRPVMSKRQTWLSPNCYQNVSTMQPFK